MIELLSYCNEIQKNTGCCHDDKRLCYCYNCLRHGFYLGSDSYSCLKKLCFYVMNYGPIYVSEIFHFLGESHLIEKLQKKTISVLSLGCGFGPDYIAIKKYSAYRNLGLNLQYYGYDQESNWLAITKNIFSNLPNIVNIMDGFSLSGYDIVFLNKVFSTLLKNGFARDFLSLFIGQVNQNMQSGSIIVYNDVNHYKLGRDIFDKSIEKVARNEGKFYFNVNSAYNNNFTPIARTDNICRTPNSLAVNPIRVATKSVFFVYKKL